MNSNPSFTSRSAVALALALSAIAAHAQEAASEGEEVLQEVSITGSRIVTPAGYQSPTPLTVINSDELFSKTANTSLRESLNTIPVFGTGYSTTTGNMVPSSNLAGISSIEMRNLGVLRTLVLLDGQRAVGSVSNGQVDVDNFPDQLIKSVEVVTGGASAVYGSDAVAGVVNFILDRDFTGVKGEVSGGMTDYGDAENYKVSVAGGFPFAAGRGHVLLSAAMLDNNGVVNGTGRPWGRTTHLYIANPAYTATNGLPEFILRDDVFLSQATHGGLITSGPLKGIAFGEGGTPYQFNYGIGLARDAFMAGGDYLSTRTDDAYSLQPEQDRQNVFTRVSFDITDNLNVYGMFSRGTNSTSGIAFPHYQVGAGPTVLSGNPFIPASVQALMTAQSLPSIRIGTMNYDMPFVTTDTNRSLNRYVVGAEGKFDTWGKTWSWNSYVQIGETKSDVYTNNVRNNARYTLALDAVRNPANGTIVCRSTLTNPGNGCVPWNPLGTGVNTQAAIDYLLGTAYSEQSTRQDVYSASITGKPFDNWAGPVSFALSAEYRKEHATVEPDPIGAVSGWHSGNHQYLNAGYHVKEAALETLIPLASGMRFLDSWDLSAAARVTDYEVSGQVETWKVGTTYAVTPGLRFRATLSRDIRAPNISELFQSQTIGLISTLDPLTGVNTTHNRTQSGNPDLKPEKADNFTIGFAAQPSFVPGLSFSVDYWKTKVEDAIRLIPAADIVRLCYLGYSQLCPNITRNPAGFIDTVNQSNFNLASQDASGLDIEANYRFPLSTLIESVPGSLSTRLLVSKYYKNISDDGVTNPIDAIGSANQPDLIGNASMTYTVDRFSVGLTARYIADSVIATNAIECQTGCPTSTEAFRTYDDIDLKGATYLDLSTSYRLDSLFGNDSASGRLYFNIRNLENKDPELIPSVGTTSINYIYSRSNGGRWDKLGRVYRIGLDFKF